MLSELPATWRERARLLERYAPEAARAFLDAALELEEAAEGFATEELSRAELAAETGVHPDTLTRAKREGRIPQLSRRAVAHAVRGTPSVEDLGRQAVLSRNRRG